MKKWLCLSLMTILLAVPAGAARARRGDAPSSPPVSLKGIGRQPKQPDAPAVTLSPIKKGQQPAETPAPTPTPAPEERTTRPRPRHPESEPAKTPAEAAPPRPAIAATAPRVDKTLSDLIAQSPSAEARDRLRSYVANHNRPEQIVPAMIRIGAISMHLGDYSGAAASYESAVKTAAQPAEKALAREGLLQALLRQNRLADAVAAWNSLTTESPTHVLSPQTQIDAGMMMAMLGKSADARRIWDQLERTLQTMPEAQSAPLRTRLALARALTDELEGRVDEALAAYQDLATRQPQTDAALLARARIADINRPLISTAPATAAKP